jgi:hypothetical protein
MQKVIWLIYQVLCQHKALLMLSKGFQLQQQNNAILCIYFLLSVIDLYAHSVAMYTVHDYDTVREYRRKVSITEEISLYF